ncbi:MAG: GGDEF domain-containing protein [Mycobacteriales bacterium]
MDASADRSGAARDRRASAGDRQQGLDDREAARSDRDRSAHDRADGILDELTGAYRRQVGLHELRRQVVEARRRQVPFVLAFVDVDGLKATNDARGHDAGDELLRQVARRLHEVVRAYDVVVRYGGDEFLCGQVDTTLGEASKRFDRANQLLQERDGGSFTAGLAELGEGESLSDLVTRADTLMYRERGQQLP